MTEAHPTSAPSPGDRSEPTARRADLLAKVLPWVARAAWVAVAIVGGVAIESAVDGRSSPVRWTAAVGGWAVFAIVAVALLIPSVRSLTAARVLSPLAVGAAIATGIAGAPGAEVALLAVPVIIAVAAIFSPEVGRWMVQASAYGDEDRLPLRIPVAAGAGAVVTWFVWAAAAFVGPLALAAQNWVLGTIAAIAAVAGAAFVGPRWHRVSKRWLVLVPAGLVVHDPVVMADTVMVRTSQLVGMSLARADTEAADLTGPASGYALQVDVSETVTTVFAFTPQEPNGRAIHMTSFLVAPTRPGEALRLAAGRGLPVH
ncbi:MAG: hypothetical protein AB8G26_09045 [Ilumatobacter sp.]